MDGRPATAPPEEIAGWVRGVAATHDPRVGPATPVFPLLTPSLPTRPLIREHSEVYVCAGVMVKIHSSHTDPGRLGQRLFSLGGTDMDRLWIQPLSYRPFPAPGGRLGSLWPRVTVLSTIDTPPWERAGSLLARLHSIELTEDAPRSGATSRLGRAVDWLVTNRPELDLAAVGAELRQSLADAPATAWVHGDFHLGQLGHTPLRSSWKLLDADAFGLGDPAWDLGRVAGFRAADLIDEAAWQTFLRAYTGAGGPAAGTGDPWDAVRDPARGALLIVAARQLQAGRDADAAVLLDAVRRLGEVTPS